METGSSETIAGRQNILDLNDVSVEQRLELLLILNSEHELNSSFNEEVEAKAIRSPMGPTQVFSYFGLMLGSLPPASFFISLIFKNGYHPPPPFVIGLMIATVFAASLTGYQSGKLVGAISKRIETRRFSKRIICFALTGLIWGIAAGAAGGVFLFIIGAFFGAAIGGIVGVVAVPLFSIPYLAVKRGTLIERRQFLPISLGVTLMICAYILGSIYR